MTEYGVVPQTVAAALPEWSFAALAWATIALELLLPIALMWPRSRPVAAIAGLGFHPGIELMMPVRMFSPLMVTMYVAFFHEDQLARARARLSALRAQLRPALRAPLALAATSALALSLALVWTANGRYLVTDDRIAAALMGLIAAVVVAAASARRRPRVAAGGPIAAAVFAAIIILEAALVARPYFADDTRFSWRMFVQTVDIQVCSRNGGLGPCTGQPDYYLWSVPAPRSHWSPWSEERRVLEAFGPWVTDTDPLQGYVGLVAQVSVNQHEPVVYRFGSLP